MRIEFLISEYIERATELVGWLASGALGTLTLAHVILIVLRWLKARWAYDRLASVISSITAPLR